MTDINFKDLEDASEWNNTAAVVVADTDEEKALKKAFGASESQATIAKYEERCTARGCNGGTFMSWSGRAVGPCYKCKGTGIRKFKTSPETRAKAKERAANRKVSKAQALVDAAAAYRKDHAELVAYLEKVSGWNGFAAKMLQAITGYGALTDPQLAAVERMIDKHFARLAAKADEPTSGLDLTNVPAGLYAIPNGDTRLKVAIRKPGKNSKWHGSIFVDDGAAYGSRKNYGRQMPGKEYEGDIVEQLKAIAADPLEASKAYGKLTDHCGVCGALLENEKSIALGIGPVCLNKF